MTHKKHILKTNKVLAVLMAVVLMASMLSACGSPEPVATESPAPLVTSTPKPEATPEPTAEPIVYELPYEILEIINGEVQTPYGILKYPEALADLLTVAKTNNDPYTLEFYAVIEGRKEIQLFDIAFGEGSGGNMGNVKTEQGEVPLNVTIYNLSFDDSWLEGEIITAQAMQDAVNEMIEQLKPVAESQQGAVPEIFQQPDEDSALDNLRIETPYCMVYYPAKWSEYIFCEHDNTQEDVYKLNFYSSMYGLAPVYLFSIYFGGDEGEQLGAVMSEAGIPVPVYLLMAELDLSYWSQSDAATIYSMQEASNQLIEKLPLLP